MLCIKNGFKKNMIIVMMTNKSSIVSYRAVWYCSVDILYWKW